MVNSEVLKITNEFLGMSLGRLNFEAHKNLWDAYEQEKSKKLFKLFGEGNYIIEKEVEFNKDRNALREEFEKMDLSSMTRKSLDPALQELISGYRPYRWDQPEETLENKLSRAASAILDLTSNSAFAGQTVHRNYEIFHPVTGKVVKIQKGAKITKVLKNFISDSEKLNNVQTLYSQVTNTKTVKGTLCLSIHPLDYLTVSVNKSGWTSCFNILEKGAWCASTLSLITSPNTMVAYLKTSEDVDYGGVEWNNKKWRAYVTLSEDNELVNIGRNYPYDKIELVQEAVKMIGEITDKEYGNLDESRRVRVYTPENMYNDAENCDLYSAVTDAWLQWQSIRTDEPAIEISHVGAICPECGEHYSDCEFDILCGSCTEEGQTCYDCGDRMGPEEGYWIDREERYVCECCYDNYYDSCERCHETMHSDSIEIVATLTRTEGPMRGENYYHDHICTSCLEDLEFIVCPTCNSKVLVEAWDKDAKHCRNCSH